MLWYLDVDKETKSYAENYLAENGYKLVQIMRLKKCKENDLHVVLGYNEWAKEGCKYVCCICNNNSLEQAIYCSDLISALDVFCKRRYDASSQVCL